MSEHLATFLSLFSGIGGLDLGLERAGWQCVGQVENDPYCNRVLAKHWPDVPRWGDIREVDPDDLPRADLVAGGFPCQPVSSSGRRLAQDDPRWLWPHMARIIRGLRPGWVLVENVPGLLARGMGDVLGDLAASGYDAEWDCVPASAVGAHHRRDRVWLVAYPGGERHGAQPGSVRGDAVRGNGTQYGHESGCGCADVADPDGKAGRPQAWDAPSGTRLAAFHPGTAESRRRGIALADPDRTADMDGGGARLAWRQPQNCGFWATEPDVGRVAPRIPGWMDRLRALGNAVVPQVAELIGRRILEADAYE